LSFCERGTGKIFTENFEEGIENSGIAPTYPLRAHEGLCAVRNWVPKFFLQQQKDNRVIREIRAEKPSSRPWRLCGSEIES